MGRSWMIGLTCVAAIFLGGCSGYGGARGEGGPCDGACAGKSVAQQEEPPAPVEDTKERTAPSGSYDLECLGRTSVSTAGGAYPEGAKGTKVPPVEQTRRRFSTKIGEADEVVGRARGTVLVIRDGRTVAIAHYLRDGSGGWLENGYDACSGF